VPWIRGDNMKHLMMSCALLVMYLTISIASKAQDCSKVPNYTKLKDALQSVIKEGKEANGGLGNQEWAVVVNRDGIVCAVVFSGPDRGKQWPGSRLIAAEKANTANALSLSDFALSTGNLYAAAQPGGSLYGLAMMGANPAVAFAGPPEKFGQTDDPMLGKPIGGVIVFGGGLALYSGKGQIEGGLGVSGDTACTDHVVAWKVRNKLGMDAVAQGVAPGGTDNLIFDFQNGTSSSGFGHPSCKGGKPAEEIVKGLAEKYRPKAK
jgi:uncharacterized protein GlcG (DUF336 family)